MTATPLAGEEPNRRREPERWALWARALQFPVCRECHEPIPADHWEGNGLCPQCHDQISRIALLDADAAERARRPYDDCE